MAQNTGTLITAAIRPNDNLDLIASAFANEIKGGVHSVTSSADRDLIIDVRREWGMLCYVNSEDTTYQLSYLHSSSNIMDPLNWVRFSGGSSSQISNKEWIDSVLSIESTAPAAITGDRYLVDSTAFGTFNGNENKVATYDEVLNSGSGGWRYTDPTEGMTLRVDTDKNVHYKYESTSWRKEYLNQVRFIYPTSSDGGYTYSYTSVNQNPIDSYSFSVFYTNFGTTNSGPVSLNIDGLGTIPVKKATNNQLVDINASDFSPGIEYQLVYQSGVFQTTIYSSSNVIGPAEDGNYNDGLFQDFTPSTPIGTPIDRFNEILLALVPPPAPDLRSWSAVGGFANGKLSFNENTPTFVAATNSITGYIGLGGTFSSSGYRLGIDSRYAQPLTGNTYYVDITGIFNSDVNVHGSLPSPAYATYSFGNSIYGTLSLYLNGSTVSSIDLTSTYSSIDTTSGGATSGIYVSSATSSKFPTSYPFEFFYNRTGTYVIKKDNGGILNGYNYIKAVHKFGSTTKTLNVYEWISDFSTLTTTFANVSTQIVQTAATKWISGIKFNNVVQIKYKARINNAYRNTYSLEQNAISVYDVSTNAVNGVYGGVNTNSSLSILSPTPEYRQLPIPVDPSDSYDFTSTLGWTFSQKANTRRVNDPITLNTTVLRTVQGTVTGATVTSPNWFIDTYSTTSTKTEEFFDDEDKRILNLNRYSSYTLKSQVISSPNKWDSTKSLRDFAGYTNGLQVINSNLIYPKFDFTTPGDLDKNPNYGGGLSFNYSACPTTVTNGFGSANNRTYTRYFDLSDFTLSNYARLQLNLYYGGCTPVPITTPLSNNTNIWVEFKLPYSTGTGTPPEGLTIEGSVTGWMDASKAFKSGQYDDGAGCLDGSVPTSSGSNWLINFGYQGTQWSGSVILIRVTVGSSWTGYLDRILITPY